MIYSQVVQVQMTLVTLYGVQTTMGMKGLNYTGILIRQIIDGLNVEMFSEVKGSSSACIMVFPKLPFGNYA